MHSRGCRLPGCNEVLSTILASALVVSAVVMVMVIAPASDSEEHSDNHDDHVALHAISDGRAWLSDDCPGEVTVEMMTEALELKEARLRLAEPLLCIVHS